MLTQGHPRRIKGLNSVIYKQMHVKTFHINKHQTQIDEELVHSIMPLLKKIYKHAHTLTQSQLHHHTLGHDWTHIAQYTVTKFELSVHSTQTHHTPWDMTGHTLLSTQSQNLNYQYMALKLKICRFLHNTGIGAHVCQWAA